MGERERTDEVLGADETPLEGDEEILISSFSTVDAEPVELGDLEHHPDPDELLRLRLLSGTGARVGRFVIRGELGEGGMGLVFAAQDEDLERRVALKLLRSAPGRDPVGAARMIREAQSLARLSHPNVVTVYEVGEFEGHVFIAMELVEGRTLKGWLRQARPDLRAILRVFVAAGRGLQAAHDAGIVHRDFKPSNVIVGADGRVTVLDFGIAMAPPSRGHGPLTQAGTVAGTPAYMAPEQLAGGAVDPRADQYAFCVALFEALTGDRPFKALTIVERIREAMGQTGTPSFPRGARVPRWLQRVVLRGLESDADRRWPSMAALAEALSRDPTRTRRRIFAGVGLAGLLVAGGYAIAHRGGSAACLAEADEVAALLPDARKATIARMIDAAEFPEGAATWGRAAPALDQEIDGLAGRWREACAAQESAEAAGDLAHSCLRRRRAALTALVGGLEGATASAVAGLQGAIDRLEPAAACLEAPAEGRARSGDRASAAEIDALRDRLEGARVAAALGHPAEGLDAAGDALDRGRELGDRALMAAALELRGALHARLGRGGAAEADLREALWLADEVRDDDRVADALAGRLDLRDADQGGPLAPGPDGVDGLAGRFELGDAKGDGKVEASAADDPPEPRTDGSADPGDGDLRRHAEAVLRRLGDDPRASTLRTALGERLRRAGDLEGARATLDEAAKAAAVAHGDNDPRTLQALLGLSLAHAAAGDLARARALQSEVLSRQEARLGAAHPGVAVALRALAASLTAGERPDEAIAPLQRALAIDEAAFGAESDRLAPTLAALGAALERAGDRAGARPLLERALTVEERTLAADDLALARAHVRLGALTLALGDLAEARRHTQAALTGLAGAEAAGRVGADEVARGLLQLAAIERQDGRQGRIGANLERGLKRCEADGEPCPPALRADLEAALADHLMSAGPRLRPRALALVEAALGRYRGLEDPDYADEIATLEGILAAEAAAPPPTPKKGKKTKKKAKKKR